MTIPAIIGTLVYSPILTGVGRSAYTIKNGTGGSYSVGYGGSPTAAGVYQLAVIWDETDDGTVTNITGGATWTPLAGDAGSSTPGMKAFYQIAGASEPSTYSVTYTGGAKSDSAGVAIIEIVGATSINTGSYTSNSIYASSGPISVTAGGTVVCLASGTMTISAQPAGYTLNVNQATSGTPNGSVAIATKAIMVTGTETPGAWTISSSSNDYLWTVSLS